MSPDPDEALATCSDFTSRTGRHSSPRRIDGKNAGKSLTNRATEALRAAISSLLEPGCPPSLVSLTRTLAYSGESHVLPPHGQPFHLPALGK